MARYFCCPHCGNKELHPTTETVTKTSGKDYSGVQGCLGFLFFGPLGLLCGLCGQGKQVNTTSTDYWICNKCGHKFRNPDDIRKGIRDGSKLLGAMTVAGLCFGLLIFIFFALAGALYDEGLLIVPAVSVGVFLGFVLIGFFMKKSADSESAKAEMEAEKLEKEMARFKGKENANEAPAAAPSIIESTNAANERVCPGCKKKVSMDASFCANCGYRLTVAPFIDNNRRVVDSNVEEAGEPGLVECIFCSKPIPANRTHCNHCGRRQD